ncbi:MAG: alkene reductase [Halieaceae bacterium]
MPELFDALALGRLQLRNRIVMAPMTRSRAEPDDMPSAVMVDYYRQRAGAGMIISEGIAPSAEGTGYCRTPGIYSDAQVDAWGEILDAVHAEGGCMVAQLMHCGRIASALNKPAHAATVAPSALAARGEIYTDQQGMVSFDTPQALGLEEIAGVVDDYARATRNAYAAGFDGVELHCTSGYLPAQFLSTGSNQRQDEYGGSVENRVRFPLQLLQAISAVDGADRVGFRICPDNPFNDLQDDDPQETYDGLLSAAAGLGLAYIHAIRYPRGRVDNLGLARQYFGAAVIGNESFDQSEAAQAVSSGELAAVSFGRGFIANPDLVERFRHDWPLAEFDPGQLYTPGAAGYTDYPNYQAE